MEKNQRNEEVQKVSSNETLDITDYGNALSKSHLPTVPTNTTEQTAMTEQPKRTSFKQRKESLEEYREIFLHAPKIIDRQPIFISRELRDKIDEVVRRLGERKMSVSGFAENVLYHHLESYKEEVEKWKRL